MIKDIVWLEKTKAAFLERKARNEKYKEEKRRREQEREAIKKEREEREKRRQEEMAKRAEEAAARQAEYERQQLKKVEVHPYLGDMDLCEQLIYYCVRTYRANTKQDLDPDNTET